MTGHVWPLFTIFRVFFLARFGHFWSFLPTFGHFGPFFCHFPLFFWPKGTQQWPNAGKSCKSGSCAGFFLTGGLTPLPPGGGGPDPSLSSSSPLTSYPPGIPEHSEAPPQGWPAPAWCRAGASGDEGPDSDESGGRWSRGRRLKRRRTDDGDGEVWWVDVQPS